MALGFLKLHRSDQALALLSADHKAFNLLTWIAFRASRKTGEAIQEIKNTPRVFLNFGKPSRKTGEATNDPHLPNGRKSPQNFTNKSSITFAQGVSVMLSG